MEYPETDRDTYMLCFMCLTHSRSPGDCHVDTATTGQMWLHCNRCKGYMQGAWATSVLGNPLSVGAPDTNQSLASIMGTLE